MKLKYQVLSILLLVLLAASCGKTAEQKLVGRWEATQGSELITVEFRGDGTVQAEGEDLQTWTLEEGDPVILRIYDMDDNSLEVELQLTFEGDDRATLTGEGMTAYMERLQ
jgi:hypothetical protein